LHSELVVGGCDWRKTLPNYYVDGLKPAPTERCIPPAISIKKWKDLFGGSLPLAWNGAIKEDDISSDFIVSFPLVSTSFTELLDIQISSEYNEKERRT
jgi:hypothetical protein